MADTLPTVSPAASAEAFPASFSGRSYESGPGLIRSSSDRIVAFAIRCCADFKIGEREFSGEVDMHDVVCLRRKYEEMGGGSVSLRPDWKPGLQRLIPLTQEKLTRVLQTMQEAFVVSRQGGGALDVLALFYGAEPSVQLKRLHEVMRLQVEAWAKLTERALARVPLRDRPKDGNILLTTAFELIAPKELDDIARIADPSSNEDGLSIELPAVMFPSTPSIEAQGAATGASLADMQARANADADGANTGGEELALIARLVAVGGVTQQQALGIATLVNLMDGAEIPDSDLADVIESKARGKIDAVRRALKG